MHSGIYPSLCVFYLQADCDEASLLGPETASESGEESQLAPQRSKAGVVARKDSAGSLESRAAPRSIGAPELPGSARSNAAELPERPSLLRRPSASASESHFSVASVARSAATASVSLPAHWLLHLQVSMKALAAAVDHMAGSAGRC